MRTTRTPATTPLGVDAPWISLHAPPPDVVMVVSRCVGGVPTGATDHLLDALAGPAGTTVALRGTGAALHLYAPSLSAAPGRRRHLRGHLRWRGASVVRSARVEVDLEPWAHGTVELTLRPVARSAPSWGPRRLRRWFHLAHLAGDELERRLVALVAAERAAATVATAAAPPVARVGAPATDPVEDPCLEGCDEEPTAA